MASLESICYTPHRSSVSDHGVAWPAATDSRVVEGLPQIFWLNATPWREANLWALERATSRDVRLNTVRSSMAALHAYAQWLERSETEWWDFPQRKADRCLVRYRGALIEARDHGQIAPSTASARMSAVVRFYRWLNAAGLLSPTWPMWTERVIGIRLTDPVGFERTITVASTNLAIVNRKAPGECLEGGLRPVSAEDRNAIIEFVKAHASEELLLLLTSGFVTGMRLGTLADLKVQTLERAIPDPASPELYRLAVGPGADPQVHTKFGVTGQAWIPRNHLERLRAYAYSVRRLKRQAKAADEHRNLVFLTRFGKPYAQRGGDKSPAINVEMHTLRKQPHQIAVLRGFHFHQTRCTFATELARIAIAHCGAIAAIAIVKEALMHRNEATSLKYVRFVEKIPAKAAAANDFTRAFIGNVAGIASR